MGRRQSFLPSTTDSNSEEKCTEDSDEMVMVGEGVDSFSNEMRSVDESECIHKLVDGLAGDLLSRGSGQGELRNAVNAAERAMEASSDNTATNTATSGSAGSNRILGKEFTLRTTSIQAFPSVLTMDGIDEEDTNAASEEDHSNYKQSNRGEKNKTFSRKPSAVNVKKAPIMDHIPEHQDSSHQISPCSSSVDPDQQPQEPAMPQTSTARLDRDDVPQQGGKNELHEDSTQSISNIASTHVAPAIPIQFQMRGTHRTLLVLASIIILLMIIITQTSMSKLIHQKTTKDNDIFFKLWNRKQHNPPVIAKETMTEKQTPQYHSEMTASGKENLSLAPFKQELAYEQENALMPASLQIAPKRGCTHRAAFQSISSWALDKSIQWENISPSQSNNYQHQMTSSEFMYTTIRSRYNQHIAENAFKVWTDQYFVHTKSAKYIARSETEKALQGLVVKK